MASRNKHKERSKRSYKSKRQNRAQAFIKMGNKNSQ